MTRTDSSILETSLVRPADRSYQKNLENKEQIGMWLIYTKNGVRYKIQIKVLSMVEGNLYGVGLDDEYIDLSEVTNFTVGYQE